MNCKNCKANPVITLSNSNISLCKSHFNRYFEKKVRRTIRIYRTVDKEDFIGVGVSGGKDSMSLLYVLNNFTGSSYFLLTCFCGVRSFAFYYHKKIMFFFLVHFWIDDHVAVSFKMRTFKMLSLLL